MTEEWIRRLYDIAISTVTDAEASGICGVCLLHTFQMLAELQEYHSREPLTSGGYFFDTAPNRDPFISFRQRYPELDGSLAYIPRVYNSDNPDTRPRLLTLISAMNMMPLYDWIPSREFTTRPEMLSHITSLISSSPGSIWLALMRRQRPDGTIAGHAVPILRTSEGLVVIPTRVPSSTSLELYRQHLTPTTDPVQVIDNLEQSDRTLTYFATIQLGEFYHNFTDLVISNRNCTGEGEGRRGTGEYPTSATVNQCSEGRCALPK
ncbi:hypothetical protein LEP1GSC064_3518 [Leptospira kirschneri serovar Grippotyphosa str. Moskva]|nr:hypothetical protein LEP1GSC064_3518 [Leptospira kirschneri serovar Grippotyphosa str. Moskva]